MRKTESPGADITARGASEIANARRRGDPEITSSRVTWQAERIMRRYGIRPPLAQAIASHAFGGAP